MEKKLTVGVDGGMDQLLLATNKANQMRKVSGVMWMYAANLALFAVFLALFIGLNSKPGKCSDADR